MPNGDGILEKEGRPFEFEIITNQGNEIRAKCAEIIQRRLAEVGIRVKIRVVEWAAFVNDFINKRKFDATILGWTIPMEPDLYDVWHSSKTGPEELNFVSYKNAEVDALIVKARETFDQTLRKRCYDRIQEILAEEQPYLFLYVPDALPIIHARFRGVESAPLGIGYNFIKWYVPAGGAEARHDEVGCGQGSAVVRVGFIRSETEIRTVGKDRQVAERSEKGLYRPAEEPPLRREEAVVHREIEPLDIETPEEPCLDFSAGRDGRDDRDAITLLDDPLGRLHVGERQGLVGKIDAGVFLKPLLHDLQGLGSPLAPDERDSVQLTEGDALPGGEGILWRTDEEQPFPMDENTLERLLLLDHSGDAQVHLAVENHPQNLIGVSHPQVDLDPRVLPVVCADDSGHEISADDRGGPYGDPSLLQGLQASEERLDFLMQSEEALRVDQQRLAFSGQADLFPRAVEEPAAYLVLQGADPLADRRLG